LRETFAAVRAVWPEHLALTARFGVIEYDGHDEETLSESIELVKQLRTDGLDLLNVSVNFNIPQARVPWAEPAFLAPVAERVRREANLPVAASWGLDKPELANRLVEQQQMDLVMIGRAFLANPHYPLQAAKALQLEKPTWVLPAPYAHWLERY
jgi:2,4-dienoyl-CoA reductase-like NADH-dependent reductase (Old Yellow Enzyme family)